MPRRLTAALLAVPLLVTACTSSSGSSDLGNGLTTGGRTVATGAGTALVVAGPNTWGDIAAQIGGSAVTVHSILDDPSKDPHEYASNASDAAAVEHAKLVITNGLGYDEFMVRLLSAGHPSGRRVLVAADVVGVHGDNANPHLWYSPQYVVQVATAIEQQLAQLVPAHAATFQDNLQAFLAGEATVTAVLQQIRTKYGGSQVAYTERVPGYLIEAAGFVLGSPASFAQSVEDGEDPSPIAAAAFDRVLSRHEVRVLIYNSQVTDSVTSRLRSEATTNGVPVVGMSETVPPGAGGYVAWQLAQARALLQALGG